MGTVGLDTVPCMSDMVRYGEGLTDSSRWEGVKLRSGDIVISTPSKCGTTWSQMICALLIFGSPDLPEPLTVLSPWLDMRLRPSAEVYALLDGQTHRRFIKTHTPLDGLPNREDVTYLLVGRDPRDVAMSMERHRANLDQEVIARTLAPLRSSRAAAPVTASPSRPATQRDRVLNWIDSDAPPTGAGMSTLRGMLCHMGGAWQRRHEANVVLLHYADLSTDLPGQMRALAGRLDIQVPESQWDALIEAATLPSMRRRAADLVPDERLGLFRDADTFFAGGDPREWQQLLSQQDLLHYHQRIDTLAPKDLIDWLHAPLHRPVTDADRAGAYAASKGGAAAGGAAMAGFLGGCIGSLRSDIFK